jgi:hypothetical protein
MLIKKPRTHGLERSDLAEGTLAVRRRRIGIKDHTADIAARFIILRGDVDGVPS